MVQSKSKPSFPPSPFSSPTPSPPTLSLPPPFLQISPPKAWEIYCQAFRALSAHLTALTSLHLRHVAPRLLTLGGGGAAAPLELAVPGR